MIHIDIHSGSKIIAFSFTPKDYLSGDPSVWLPRKVKNLVGWHMCNLWQKLVEKCSQNPLYVYMNHAILVKNITPGVAYETIPILAGNLVSFHPHNIHQTKLEFWSLLKRRWWSDDWISHSWVAVPGHFISQPPLVNGNWNNGFSVRVFTKTISRYFLRKWWISYSPIPPRGHWNLPCEPFQETVNFMQTSN